MWLMLGVVLLFAVFLSSMGVSLLVVALISSLLTALILVLESLLPGEKNHAALSRKGK